MEQLKELSLEITQRCPNCCLHCSSLSSMKAKNELPYPLIKRTLWEAKGLGATTISLSGGEPFMHPKLREIVHYIKNLGMACFIYTSGLTYINNDYCSILKDVLEEIKGEVEKLIINIESVNPINYKRIMGTDFNGFTLMQKSIATAVSLGFIVEAHLVPMKINYKEILSVIEWCHNIGISKVSFLRLVLQGRAMENSNILCMNDEQTQEVTSLVNFVSKKGYNLRLGIPFSDCRKKINCFAGTQKINIRYDGRVFPCEAFKGNQPGIFSKYKIDNIYDNSLIDIYNNSPYLKNVREVIDHYQNIRTDEPCVNQYYRKNK